MLSSLFPLIYGLIFIVLLWQAFRVMGRGFSAAGKPLVAENVDRTGRLTEEDLLTVRFGGDSEPPNPTSKPGE